MALPDDRGRQPTRNFGRIASVTIGTKQGVGWTLSSIVFEKRAHILPDDLFAVGDFKDPTRPSLADEGVSVGQPLCSAYVRAVKGVLGPTLVFPDGFPRIHVHLNDPGKRNACAMTTVGE